MAFSGLYLVQLKIVTATVCVSAQLDICQDMSTSMTVFMTVLSQKIEEQANDLLGGRKEVLSPMKVQQQRNDSDCGVFAIAFSNCLAFGEDPTFVNFDVLRMRSHLAACLRNGRISLFSSF